MPSHDELAELIDAYEPAASPDVVEHWHRLFDPTNDDGPITLVNRFTLRQCAVYEDDRMATGLEAFMTYAATSVPAMEQVGARFLVSSPVVAPLFGTPVDTELVVVGWFPRRQALLALLRNPEYRAAFEHRRAAVASEWVVAVNAMAG